MSPFFRPIKYSLFAPLGLATLAGYLGDEDEVSGRARRAALSGGRAGPGGDPGLHHLEGRLLHRDWDLYDTRHVVFTTRSMTAQELEAGYWRA